MNDTFPAHILNTCAIICHIKAQPVAVQAGGFDQTIHPQDPGAVVYIVLLPVTALVFLFVSCSFVGVVMSSSISWFSCYFSPCRGIDGLYFWHVFTFCLRAPSSSASTAKVSTLREVSGNWQELQRQRAMAEADLASSVNVRKKFCNFGAAQVWSTHINIPYKLPRISPQPATFPAGNPRPHRCQHSTCWSKVCWQGCKFQLFYLASSSFYLWCLHPVLSCFFMFFLPKQRSLGSGRVLGRWVAGSVRWVCPGCMKLAGRRSSYEILAEHWPVESALAIHGHPASLLQTCLCILCASRTVILLKSTKSTNKMWVLFYACQLSEQHTL